MRMPSSLSPLSLLALGRGLSAPVTALAANTPDLRPGVIRSTAALGPARLLTGAEAEKARLVTGIDRAASGTFALATGAGHVFHRTAQPIHALKTLDVPRASVQLHTWQEETADGRRQDFFAYSQGGVALLGRVQATEYLVRLEHARFDPLRGAQPLVAGLLSADANNTLHLVQFHATPLPEYRDAIKAAGGKVLRFLTDHTFLVEMNASTHKRVAGLPYVRWVGAYHPEYRVEGVLRESLQGRALKLEPQRYSIMVGERGAARQGEVASLVRTLGGTVELDRSRRPARGGHPHPVTIGAAGALQRRAVHRPLGRSG